MKRNISKYISEYDDMISKNSKQMFIQLSDINDIMQISKNGGVCDMVVNALKVGMMIGYKRGLRVKR